MSPHPSTHRPSTRRPLDPPAGGVGSGPDRETSSPPGMRDWSADLTGFRDRLGERLAARGYRHPHVAAAALAARGSRGVDRRSFADQLGLPVHAVEAAESGELGHDDLPPALTRSIRSAATPLLEPPRST